MTMSEITRMPRACAASSRFGHVVDRPELRQHRVEVGDVVAAVAQRRVVERQQPDAVDPEPLEVVEPLGEPADVTGAVVVRVVEAAGQTS
jgi:hypothetical protein